MIGLTGLLACVLLTLWLIPNSELGKMLHRVLVERPASLLLREPLKSLIYALIVGGTMLSGGEMMFLLGPELFTMWALDLAIYLDAVLVTYALAFAVRARATGSWALTMVRRPLRRARARQRRARRKPQAERRPANDDDDAPAFAAFAA